MLSFLLYMKVARKRSGKEVMARAICLLELWAASRRFLFDLMLNVWGKSEKEKRTSDGNLLPMVFVISAHN